MVCVVKQSETKERSSSNKCLISSASVFKCYLGAKLSVNELPDSPNQVGVKGLYLKHSSILPTDIEQENSNTDTQCAINAHMLTGRQENVCSSSLTFKSHFATTKIRRIWLLTELGGWRGRTEADTTFFRVYSAWNNFVSGVLWRVWLECSNLSVTVMTAFGSNYTHTCVMHNIYFGIISHNQN